MKTNKYLYILLLLFLVPFSASSQDTLRHPDDYLLIAAENNPELKAAFNIYLAAHEKVTRAGSLPDPEASFGLFVRPMPLLGGNELASIQLMQMFPWFGTRTQERNEAGARADVKYADFLSKKADLFYRVRVSWYRLSLVDQESAFLQEQLVLFQSMENLVLNRFAAPPTGKTGPVQGAMGNAGDMMNGMDQKKSENLTGGGSMQMPDAMAGTSVTLQDILRIRMEILDLKERLEQVHDRRSEELAAFNALLNREPESAVVTPDTLIMLPLTVHETTIIDSILKNNPLQEKLNKEVESYAAMKEMARLQAFPKIGLGMNYMLIAPRDDASSGMNGMDMVMPMVSLSVPINQKKYKAMQNEAGFLQDAAGQMAGAMTNQLQSSYYTLLSDLEGAQRRMVLYKEQQMLAQQTADLLLVSYTVSGADLDEVLKMKQKVIDYGLRRINALTDYNIAVSLADKLMNTTVIF